jgi:hypothetical protein
MAGVDIIMMTNNKIIFAKAGVVTTNASGLAYVVFTNSFEYNLSYCVQLTCEYPGLAYAVTAYPSNLSQTGFTITSRDTHIVGGGGDLPVANVIVHWCAIPYFN